MIPSQLDLVNEHTTAVQEDRIYWESGNSCPKCEGQPPWCEPRYLRERWFYPVVDGYVHPVRSFVLCLRCPLCRRVFTDYPPFALPYKRYLLPEVSDRSRSYVTVDELTYRRGVQENRMAVGYASHDDGTIDERQLVHTTLWRWVGFFGRMNAALRGALQWLREKEVTLELFRHPCLVPARKYRSRERKLLLQTALRLFDLEPVFVRLSSRFLFPEFATACHWN